jgi:hypothetical protein
VRVCVHRVECVRVCMVVFDCTVFRKKKISSRILIGFGFKYGYTEPWIRNENASDPDQKQK